MLNTDAYPRGETTGAEQSRWTLGYAGCCHGGECSDVCVWSNSASLWKVAALIRTDAKLVSTS